MSSNPGDNRFIDGINRAELVVPEANISKSPSAKRRFHKFQVEDLFTGTTNTPHPSPKIQIKRSTIDVNLRNNHTDLDKGSLDIEFCGQSTIPKNKTYADNLSSLQNRNYKQAPLGKSPSSPTLFETYSRFSIFEKAIEQNLKPTSFDTGSLHEYWLTSKLKNVFKTVPKTCIKEVPNKVTDSKPTSSVLESGDIRVKNAILESNKANIPEKQSILKRLGTWLTTSEVKHKNSGSESDGEVAGIVRMGKAAYRWSTTKKVNVDSKDLNMISPTSL